MIPEGEKLDFLSESAPPFLLSTSALLICWVSCVLYFRRLTKPALTYRWQARRDSNPQPPDLESGALPFELLACLLGFLVWQVGFTKRTVFFQFQFVRHCLFIFCRRVVPLLTCLACQRNGISHNMPHQSKAAGASPAALCPHYLIPKMGISFIQLFH